MLFKTNRLSVLMLLGLVALSGCATLETKERMVTLEASVKRYGKAIRWGDYDVAASFVRQRDTQAPEKSSVSDVGASLPNSHGVRVVQHEVRIGAASEEATEANMVAVFTYHLDDSTRVRVLSQNAIWWYDEATQAWFLEGSLPNFRQY